MGIYFIAAGNSSKNRQKTLEKSHSIAEIFHFLPSNDQNELKKSFSNNDKIYVWGANKKNLKDLQRIREGEFVVDVKNKVVVQIFTYCFYIKTGNTKLQEFLGWDQEKPLKERRPYNYVYFLKNPATTVRREKKYFQVAFDLTHNQNWLVGQKYFSDAEVSNALERTLCRSPEALLGITNNQERSIPKAITTIPPIIPPVTIPKKLVPIIEVPSWLKDLISKINALKNDSEHFERDHEELVASLFELLGYKRIYDIKFRRGNIDIRIDKNNKPIITVEVKADWALSPESRNALSQAYNYALETGTPFIIITNGDRFCVYDRRHGMSYKENLIADFTLTKMTEKTIDHLNLLKKETIQ